MSIWTEKRVRPRTTPIVNGLNGQWSADTALDWEQNAVVPKWKSNHV